MKQRLLIALLTAFGFAAGFGARMLTESGPAVPPPPAPGTEFVRSSTAAPAVEARQRGAHPVDRTRLVAQIEQIRPAIEIYRNRIEQIAAEFDRELVPLLTPEQRERFEARQKKDAERHARGDRRYESATTLSDEQISELQQRPLWFALYNVAITWRLERLNRDLKLDEAQQAKVKELLRARREKFLALVDSSPPYSITLSQLATQMDKIAQPAKK